MRRYNELAACIVAREFFDPIVFEVDDERGEPLAGKDGMAALAPWAAGFANATSRRSTAKCRSRLHDALDELVACVLEIAEITRPNRPATRKTPKVGRNDPCPCGSGRKYKVCHGQ